MTYTAKHERTLQPSAFLMGNKLLYIRWGGYDDLVNFQKGQFSHKRTRNADKMPLCASVFYLNGHFWCFPGTFLRLGSTPEASLDAFLGFGNAPKALPDVFSTFGSAPEASPGVFSNLGRTPKARLGAFSRFGNSPEASPAHFQALGALSSQGCCAVLLTLQDYGLLTENSRGWSGKSTFNSVRTKIIIN